jgi:predicted PurR-regulated permease PerM
MLPGCEAPSMSRQPPSRSARPFDDHAFLLLVVVVTVAFGWVVAPFFSAVFWSTVLAILFMPLHRRLVTATGGRSSLSALATLVVILVIVVLPTAFVSAALVQEAGSLVARVKSGELDFAAQYQALLQALPPWIAELATRFGLHDLSGIRDRLSESVLGMSQVAVGHVLNVGQNTFGFLLQLGVMLYVLFFLLRDGAALVRRIRAAVPLSDDLLRDLMGKFATAIRATVRGNIAVALVQGALGGLIFWFLGVEAPVLWGVLMALLSLLPAVGAGLVWGPVAVYFLATGSVWQGLLLAGYGVLVIGLVDNILRPILVGKDTKMPDYVVLISTLGGLAVFGLVGFVVGPVIAALFIAVWEVVASYRANSHGTSAQPDAPADQDG